VIMKLSILFRFVILRLSRNNVEVAISSISNLFCLFWVILPCAGARGY